MNASIWPSRAATRRGAAGKSAPRGCDPGGQNFGIMHTVPAVAWPYEQNANANVLFDIDSFVINVSEILPNISMNDFFML